MKTLRIAVALLGLILTALSWGENPAHFTATLPIGKPGQTVNAQVHVLIAPGWHLYGLTKSKGEGPVPTEIKALSPLVPAGPVQQPTPIKKFDSNFNMNVEYFQMEATFTVPVKLGAKPGEGTIQVRYQVCNDSVCMPPKTVVVSVGGGAAEAAPKDAFAETVHRAKSDGILAFAGFALVAGFLSLLTPCVFPLIPITVSYFTKQREKNHSGLAPIFAYCAGIIGSFAGFGLLVTLLFGAGGVQRFATNPWVNLVLAVVFVLLALSLFGILNVNLPSSITNRFTKFESKGGLITPVLMGLTFTLTSFTCTVPAVGTILAGATQGNLLYPLVGMLAYGTAFALPFFVLALFPRFLAKMPKSGSWLETVKGFMGFLEIAAALKFLSNTDLVLQTGVLPRPIFLVVWAVVMIASGVYLLGGLPFLHGSKITGKPGPGRLVFSVLSIVSAVWFLSATGGRSLGEAEAFLPPSESGWITSYQRGIEIAQKKNLPLLINFTGVTCTNCRWMEKNMFSRSDVQKAFKNYVLVELYTDRATEGDRMNQRLQEQLTGVTTLPVYVSVGADGTRHKIFQGSTRNPQEFLGFLGDRALSASR